VRRLPSLLHSLRWWGKCIRVGSHRGLERFEGRIRRCDSLADFRSVTGKSLESYRQVTGARYAQDVFYGLVGFPQKSTRTVSASDALREFKETNGIASAALTLDHKRACSPVPAIGAYE
jgi:hypothetical protein